MLINGILNAFKAALLAFWGQVGTYKYINRFCPKRECGSIRVKADLPSVRTGSHYRISEIVSIIRMKLVWKSEKYVNIRLLVWSTNISIFPKLFMAGNIRHGTGRYCFDMFGGKKN